MPAPELSVDLETRLTEFLQVAPPLRETLTTIVDRLNEQDAARESFKKEVQENLESHHFRLRMLEAAAGRGWMGIARIALIAVLAAGSGYAIAFAQSAISASHR